VRPQEDEVGLGKSLRERAVRLLSEATAAGKVPLSWRLSTAGERFLLRAADAELVRAHCAGREPTLFGLPVEVVQFVPHGLELVGGE
jgi:hypothetical protein